MLSTHLAGTPQILAWESHPKFSQKGRQRPALKLPPVAPLLTWCWLEQEVDFSPQELQKPVQRVPQPSQPRGKLLRLQKPGIPFPG